MKTSTILRKASKVLTEKGWCKGELARNKYRHKVDPTSPSAVRYCALGALHKVLDIGDTWGLTELQDAKSYLESAVPWEYLGLYVHGYNDLDATALEDVRAWFQRAIILARLDEGASK